MAAFNGIDHIDIVVKDPSVMADYLISLGFTLVRKTADARGSIEVGFPGEGNQPILELTPADTGNGHVKPLGLRHIALRTSDINQTYERLSAAGFVFDKPPRVIADTGRTLTNLKDPEGGTLQVVDMPEEV